MALINCYECNQQISDKASACPNCGAPKLADKEHPATPRRRKLMDKPASPPNKKPVLVAAVAGLVLSGGVAFFVMNQVTYDEGSSNDGYNETELTVDATEQANPRQFLDASGTFIPSVRSDNIQIDGTVKNNATVTNYKDVVIKVTYYSGTDTELDSKNYVVYDKFTANTTKNFSLEVERPSACEKVSWDAVDATPY